VPSEAVYNAVTSLYKIQVDLVKLLEGLRLQNWTSENHFGSSNRDGSSVFIPEKNNYIQSNSILEKCFITYFLVLMPFFVA
jgi:hypothetical protein